MSRIYLEGKVKHFNKIKVIIKTEKALIEVCFISSK